MKTAQERKQLLTGELSLEDCKRKFDLEGYGYSDEEIQQLSSFLFGLVKMYHSFYQIKDKPQAKVIALNQPNHDSEESHSLCARQYRRAS